MAKMEQEFAEAYIYWDLETLYQDLASIKGKNLTPVEKQHLRGLLCGCSPAEIAKKLNKNIKGVEIAFSNTLYQYVKNLVGESNGKIKNWRSVIQWLDNAGYKNKVTNAQKIGDYSCLDIAIKDFDVTVRKCNLNIKNNHLLIDLNIRLSSPLSDNQFNSDDIENNFTNIEEDDNSENL